MDRRTFLGAALAVPAAAAIPQLPEMKSRPKVVVIPLGPADAITHISCSVRPDGKALVRAYAKNGMIFAWRGIGCAGVYQLCVLYSGESINKLIAELTRKHATSQWALTIKLPAERIDC